MAIFGKLAYAAGVSPGAVLLLRFGLAAIVLGVLLALRPGLRPGRPASAPTSPPGGLTRRLLLTALGLGAVGYATQASLYFAALERIDASLVALVLYTYPALVTLTAALLGRDRLTPGRCAALAVATSGILLVLVGAGGVSFNPIGVAMAFGAAVTYTGYILVTDAAVHHVPPVVLSALVMTGASVTLAGRAPRHRRAGSRLRGSRMGLGGVHGRHLHRRGDARVLRRPAAHGPVDCRHPVDL